MDNNAIEVRDVSKKFFIGSLQSTNKTLKSFLQEIITRPFRRLSAVASGRAPTHVDEEMWALKNLNLNIKQGESVGIIGVNGSGKSTLLQLIAGVIAPTKGEIITRGHLIAMLNVGTGFHQELTGRENVYINASILGLSTAEVDAIYDKIVEFAGIEKFMDTPLKRYSTGMRVRLAFAVAVNIKPDIIILDEVLAVGDLGFREKSISAMEKLHKDTTLIIASHNVHYLKRICDRVMWIDKGIVRADGNPNVVINDFLAETTHGISDNTHINTTDDSETWIKLLQLSIKNSVNYNIVDRATRSSLGFQVQLTYEVLKNMTNLRITCNILDANNDLIVLSTSDADIEPRHQRKRPTGLYTVTFEVPPSLLTAGDYYFDIIAEHPNKKPLKLWRNVRELRIIDVDSARSKYFNDSRSGYINLPTEWVYETWAAHDSDQSDAMRDTDATEHPQPKGSK